MSSDAPPPIPRRKLAILACMDTRLDPLAALGLGVGDAHVIRNAGGVATDDAIRSLALSQHMLGTTAIAVMGHTDCGLSKTTDDEFADRLEAHAGERPPWRALAFADLEDSVRSSVAALSSSPFLPHRDAVRGYVLEVETGRLREVD
jgi:carbonic anhydrase